MSDVLADGTIFAGDFRVIRVIHAGGLSTLYEVEQVSTGVRRALKVVAGALGKDDKLRELFLEEAKRVGRVQSDHVAELLSCGVDASTDLPFAILELVQGETLAELMIRRGSLGPHEALDLLEQISHAVAAAHDVGLVHRDLKPEGILIGQSRSKSATARVVVLFLGVGKLASEAKHNTTAAMSRPLWMAPEQTETDVTPTAATDVWAQGLLAYHLLTGRHYWKTARDMGSAMMSLMREVLFEDFVKASDRAREQGVVEKLPYGFDPWFARCVVRDRAQRFQHAREAMQELGACLAPFAANEELRLHVPSVTPPPAAFGPLPPIARPPLASGSYPPGPHLPPPSMPPPRGPLPPLPTPPKPPSGPPVGLIAAAIAALVVLAALGIGIGVFYLRAARTAHVDRDDEGDQKSERHTKKPSPWSDEACPVPVSSKDPSSGDRLAPVTIVEFSDYQCSLCKKADETIVDLEALYGKSKLRIVWKNNPLAFHPNARPAALAARAVFELEGDDAFWRFHQSAFADQKGLAPEAYSRWATAAGVEKKSFDASKDDAAVAKKIDDDLALGASIGVKGTPAFFVNGRALVGAQPKEKFQNAIDLALAEAQAEAKQGTPADKMYVTLTQRNYKKDAPSDPTPTPATDDQTLYRVPVGASPVRGPKTALVTIVEFGDFQCPFCAKSEGTLTDLSARYPGKIRIVWKDSPLLMHARAMAAANFAREVRAKKGDDGFWKAHDLLLTNQKRLEDADLSSFGLDLGVDGVSLVAAAQSEKHKKEIAEDQDLADALGATGTPVFYINGRKLIGAVPVEKFAQLVDEELPKAQALVQAGTPAEAVYDELTKNGNGGKDLEKKEPGPIPVGAPTRGANKPLVVIQEFSDLQCPFCKRAETTLDDVLRDYGDKVQIVWRHNPLDFHKDAHMAAEAAEEVKAQKGNDAFFKFKTKAFAAQPNGLDRAGLERMANELGLDMPKFRRSLDDHTHSARVDADVSAAKALGFTGTPTFLVGKFVISGAQPEAAFRRAIDRALAEPK